MILDDILSAVVTRMESIVIADTQTRFAELDSGILAETALDYAFTIDDVSVHDRNGTGVPGKVFRVAFFTVVFKALNEGRSVASHASLAAQHATAVQDRVTDAVHAVAGVGACFTNAPADVTRDPAEPTVYYVGVPFQVEYTDDVITA